MQLLQYSNGNLSLYLPTFCNVKNLELELELGTVEEGDVRVTAYLLDCSPVHQKICQRHVYVKYIM